MNTSLISTIPTEHEFAQYIRILGKGKKGSRSLSQSEAKAAMALILANKVEDVQLGAFLVLLRKKEETPEEIAGFVEAARESSIKPANKISVDLDWSSYAGKRKHVPWFVLSALVLAGRGIRVFMHGSAGHTEGRLYTQNALEYFSLPISHNWQMAEDQLKEHSFTYMPLAAFCNKLQQIIDLRGLLGLRSPVHTLSRLLNPLAAEHSLQSVFHPSYCNTHQEAARLLHQPNMAVLKGDGGEFERRPNSTTNIKFIKNGIVTEETWARHTELRQTQTDALDIEQMRDVWRGSNLHENAEAIIIGTLAIIINLLGHEKDESSAMALAAKWWQERDMSRI